MTDKYQPIPGEMDTIDCLRKERDEFRALIKELMEALEEALHSVNILAGKYEIDDYMKLSSHQSKIADLIQEALTKAKEALEKKND